MTQNNFQSPKQLNPFELKAEITKLLEKLKGINDLENYEIHYRTLDAQSDKKIIVKLLFKEIANLKDDGKIIKFLLKRYADRNELTERLWAMVKSNIASNMSKIFALDLLRDIDSGWSYDTCDAYLDNPEEFVDEDTKKLLATAILNPEVQIDFLDFLNSLTAEDKVILLKSLGQDYEKDELANILIPVFLSQPDSEAGKTAIEILGNSKSQLAYHALNTAMDYVPENLKPTVKKNISTLKLSGIREDNSIEFYKKILENSKPYKCCITYPDGHGNIAVIISRINKSGKVQFVAIVIDDYRGIRDCFGFNEITKFECNTIIERFYREEKEIYLQPEVIKTLLHQGEIISHKSNNWLIPYEYVCWKNLLADVEEADNNIKSVLDNEFSAQKILKEELQEITVSDFMLHWFLDSDYSDEFQEFLQIINNAQPEDFDKIIDNYVLKVFYKEEFDVWSERLLTVAYIKLKEGLNEEAHKIYNLYYDMNMKIEFFKNIMRISVYQYYFKQQNENIPNASEIVSKIERMWVANV